MRTAELALVGERALSAAAREGDARPSVMARQRDDGRLEAVCLEPTTTASAATGRLRRRVAGIPDPVRVVVGLARVEDARAVVRAVGAAIAVRVPRWRGPAVEERRGPDVAGLIHGADAEVSEGAIRDGEG